MHNTCSTGTATAVQMDLWSTGIYTGTSTGTSTGSMTRGRSIGFGSRTDTALHSSLLSTISYLVRLASSFLSGNGMPDLDLVELKRRRRAAARTLLSRPRSPARRAGTHLVDDVRVDRLPFMVDLDRATSCWVGAKLVLGLRL